MYTLLLLYPGGTLLQKSFKIRSWVPSPQMPCCKTINRSHAHNTHDKNKDDAEQQNTKTLTHTQDTHTQRRTTTA